MMQWGALYWGSTAGGSNSPNQGLCLSGVSSNPRRIKSMKIAILELTVTPGDSHIKESASWRDNRIIWWIVKSSLSSLSSLLASWCLPRPLPSFKRKYQAIWSKMNICVSRLKAGAIDTVGYAEVAFKTMEYNWDKVGDLYGSLKGKSPWGSPRRKARWGSSGGKGDPRTYWETKVI